MKLIKPSVEIRKQGAGEDGMFEHIEWAGRHCYKSHDKTTADSARAFVGRIAKSGHGSVLEHGTIYLAIPFDDMPAELLTNPYTKCKLVHTPAIEDWYAVTTNYRVIVENNWDLLLMHRCEPTCEHEKRITAKFVTDRAVTHELVRHRTFSFCLSGDSIVYSTKQKKWTIKQLYEWQSDYKRKGRIEMMNIRSVDEETKVIVPNKIKKIFLTGEKDVYEVVTKSGRKLKTTLDHRFFTPNGYVELKDLKIGDKVYANGKELLENEDWLREMYLEKNLTRKELSQMIGCCEEYLRRSFRKFGIFKDWSMRPNRHAGHGVKGMHSEEEKKRISERMSGSNNHQWSDEKTEGGARQYARKKYRKDHCELCGATGKLEQHHWDKNPLNYDESNLITLCVPCHKQIHGIGKKAVFHDEIVSIAYAGKEEVYDIEMQGIHNFVANGLVVHNCQESQRYCNYGKDKFGSQITFIKPSWWNSKSADKENFKIALLTAENTYLQAIKAWDEKREDKRFRTKFKGNPLSPQMARMILPNATKTELVMTGFESDWEFFFKLRCSPAAHPDARYLANKLKHIIESNEKSED